MKKSTGQSTMFSATPSLHGQFKMDIADLKRKILAITLAVQEKRGNIEILDRDSGEKKTLKKTDLPFLLALNTVQEFLQENADNLPEEVSEFKEIVDKTVYQCIETIEEKGEHAWFARKIVNAVLRIGGSAARYPIEFSDMEDSKHVGAQGLQLPTVREGEAQLAIRFGPNQVQIVGLVDRAINPNVEDPPTSALKEHITLTEGLTHDGGKKVAQYLIDTYGKVDVDSALYNKWVDAQERPDDLILPNRSVAFKLVSANRVEVFATVAPKRGELYCYKLISNDIGALIKEIYDFTGIDMHPVLRKEIDSVSEGGHGYKLHITVVEKDREVPEVIDSAIATWNIEEKLERLIPVASSIELGASFMKP